MKKLRMKRLGLWLTVALCLALGLCLFVGCTPDGGDTETDPDTTVAGDTPTEEPTAAPTEEPTEEPSSDEPATDEPTTDEPTTEAPTEELKGWEQDTGKFNDGIVVYDKLVETEVHAAYPDDKLGRLMEPGQEGVIKQRGISEKSFYYWLRKLRSQMADDTGSQLVQLEMDSMPDDRLQIQYRGAELKLPGSVDMEAVATLLHSLQRQC